MPTDAQGSGLPWVDEIARSFETHSFVDFHRPVGSLHDAVRKGWIADDFPPLLLQLRYLIDDERCPEGRKIHRVATGIVPGFPPSRRQTGLKEPSGIA